MIVSVFLSATVRLGRFPGGPEAAGAPRQISDRAIGGQAAATRRIVFPDALIAGRTSSALLPGLSPDRPL